MKMKNTLRLAVAITALAGLSGCGGGLGIVENIVNGIFKLKSGVVTIEVHDAATGRALTTGATITLSGGMLNQMFDAMGLQVNAQTINNGVANFYTENNGILMGTVKADGYLPGAFALDVSGEVSFGTVKLVRLSAPPTGVTVDTATVPGTLTDSLRIGSLAASLTYAKGSAFTQVDGVPASQARATVVHYDVTKATSSIPGALHVKQGGNYDPILFAGAAVMSSLSPSGTSVSVQPAATLRLRIPNSSNPATGFPYTEGDPLTIVRLPEGAIEWIVAGSTTVQVDDEGLFALVPASYPGGWGVGMVQSTQCNQPTTFTFPKMEGYNVDVTLGRPGWSYSFPTVGRTEVQVTGLPVGKSMSVGVTFQNRITVLQANSRTYACGEIVTIDDTLDISTFRSNFNLSAVCSDGTSAPAELKGMTMVLFNGSNVLSGAGFADTTGNLTIRGLDATTTYKYVIPLSPLGDVVGSVQANGGSVQLQLPCTRIVTGATGGSGL